MFKKSIMLPVLAVIAGAAASAFTTVNSTQHSKADLYWYKVDASTDQVIQVIGQTSEANAEELTGCQNQTSVLCAYGYQQDPGYSIGDEATPGDQSFNKSQQ